MKPEVGGFSFQSWGVCACACMRVCACVTFFFVVYLTSSKPTSSADSWDYFSLFLMCVFKSASDLCKWDVCVSTKTRVLQTTYWPTEGAVAGHKWSLNQKVAKNERKKRKIVGSHSLLVLVELKRPNTFIVYDKHRSILKLKYVVLRCLVKE